jgi:hypothetical protein
MQSPPLLKARLVHAEPGSRVVEASAWRGEHCIGSCLGEAADAEQAEQRARQRLQELLAEQLSPQLQPPSTPVSEASPAEVADPEPEPAPAPTAPQPSPRATLIRHGGAAPSLPKVSPPATAPASAPPEPQADPDDWSDELAELDVQLQRLGWDRSQEGVYLERCFGHPSRSRITSYADLVGVLRGLRGLAAGADPTQAAVPLRRSDLLQQSDQLLQSLRWDAAQGRELLEQHFQLSSRQQLNDEQLLQFNMLLEGELIQAGSGLPAAVSPG